MHAACPPHPCRHHDVPLAPPPCPGITHLRYVMHSIGRNPTPGEVIEAFKKETVYEVGKRVEEPNLEPETQITNPVFKELLKHTQSRAGYSKKHMGVATLVGGGAAMGQPAGAAVAHGWV